MLSFFPTIYPDEIFYSVFARYHKQSGNKDINISSSIAFGRKSKRFIVDLPNDLDFLTSQLPTYTSDYIIENHTLFNYYAPFIPFKKSETLYQRMRCGAGNGLSGLIGKTNNLSSRGEFLYYCPKCAVYDFNKYGEAYFHRPHQVSGTKICQIHFCLLNK